ncbi:MAG: hypothetical protein EBU46_15035 [Nitrosomonadaceae bacterium]|nr:hypothetical protein [Nitrosomonadaceae bacterium]
MPTSDEQHPVQDRREQRDFLDLTPASAPPTIQQIVTEHSIINLTNEADLDFIRRIDDPITDDSQDQRPVIRNYRGPWLPGVRYERGDLVVLPDNSAWAACWPNTDVEPNSWNGVDTWDYIDRSGPPLTRTRRMRSAAHADEASKEPSLYDEPKCPVCRTRGCTASHPESATTNPAPELVSDVEYIRRRLRERNILGNLLLIEECSICGQRDCAHLRTTNNSQSNA